MIIRFEHLHTTDQAIILCRSKSIPFWIMIRTQAAAFENCLQHGLCNCNDSINCAPPRAAGPVAVK